MSTSMAIARELLALAVAAAAAFLAFLVLGGGPRNTGEIDVYVRAGWWYAGPPLVVVSAVLAPVFFVLRRRGRLNLWTVLALYALFPVVLSIEGLLIGLGTPSIHAAFIYIACGVAAGFTYWAISSLSGRDRAPSPNP